MRLKCFIRPIVPHFIWVKRSSKRQVMHGQRSRRKSCPRVLVATLVVVVVVLNVASIVVEFL